MKKNFAMRIAACLLVVTMLSLCMVSYTYAKYTTSGATSDIATVAKWGITLSVQGDDILYDDAKTGDEVTALKVTANNLTAPGTYQKLATVALTGTPEVAYQIVVEVDLELGDYWVANSNVYCPLVFTVDGTTYKIDLTDDAYDTVDELEVAIENAIKLAICGSDTGTAVYDAGEPVPATAADGVLIDWMWAYDSEVVGAHPEQTDVLDTELGNAANKATVNFNLTVTVTQVD